MSVRGHEGDGSTQSGTLISVFLIKHNENGYRDLGIGRSPLYPSLPLPLSPDDDVDEASRDGDVGSKPRNVNGRREY